MRTRFIYTFIVLLTMFFPSLAQVKSNNTNPAIQKINIGQAVPDYTLTNLMNYRQKTAKMSDFKGKILIFDFWTFGCVSCVESWPKLMKLQEKFKDKIQIIIVNTDQTGDKIQSFIKRQEEINKYKMTLTGTSGDKNLITMFPHQSVPHVIFIDPNGIVTNITAGFMLHEQTIKDMLDGKKVKTAVKTDDYAIAWNKPMFINGNYGATDSGANVLGTTIIAPYTPDVISTSHVSITKLRSVGIIANFPISSIFSILYGTGVNPIDGVPTSRIVYRGMDSTAMVARINGILQTQNLYCIQTIVKKPVSISLMKQKMITDFEFNIGFKAHWEKQNKICVVISKSNDAFPVYKEGPRAEAIWKFGIKVNNLTMQEFINRMNFSIPAFYSTPYPFVDETGFTGKLGNILIESPDVALDLRTLAKHLSKYGMTLSLKEQLTDVLVITENKLPTNGDEN